ncbi:TPA: hypothetical protein HA241_07215 [Candidatus Woesearchaeota archaeon]|nr:hypothetical protein [Candidatus Woesearchaeota archaeon]
MNHRTKGIVVGIAFIFVNVLLAFFIAQTVSEGMFWKSIVGGSSITGAVVVSANGTVSTEEVGCVPGEGHSCRIVCRQDNDCDDGMSVTRDVCRNPGTVYSLCVNMLS